MKINWNTVGLSVLGGMLATAIFFAALALSTPAQSAELRDPAQRHKFATEHACPATGKTGAKCPGYVVDHIVPLCGGGKDEPANMQWQKRVESYKKDIKERAYCRCLRAKKPVCVFERGV